MALNMENKNSDDWISPSVVSRSRPDGDVLDLVSPVFHLSETRRLGLPQLPRLGRRHCRRPHRCLLAQGGPTAGTRHQRRSHRVLR